MMLWVAIHVNASLAQSDTLPASGKEVKTALDALMFAPRVCAQRYSTVAACSRLT